MNGVELRDARADEADLLATIHLEARAAAMPWLPVLHAPEKVGQFFREQILPAAQVTVLTVAARPVAFIACTPGWIDHLYVAPAHWRRGYGARLLNSAKRVAVELQLWTFQRNMAARAFYAAAGFREVELTSGERNEEQTPDVRLIWRPASKSG